MALLPLLLWRYYPLYYGVITPSTMSSLTPTPLDPLIGLYHIPYTPYTRCTPDNRRYGAEQVLVLISPVSFCMLIVICTIKSVTFFSTNDSQFA